MIRKILLLVAFLTFSFASAQTVKEVLDMHYEAIGGKDNFDAIKSWHLVGKSKLSTNEPGDFQFIYVRPSQIKIRTIIDTFKIIQSVNVDKGWQVNPASGIKDPIPMKENEVLQILGQKALVLGPFYDYKEKGATITYGGVVTRDSIDYKVLRLQTKNNGPKSTIYLNDSTNLIHVIETETVNGGMAMNIVNVISNYNEVDGFMLPFSFVSNINGKQYTQLELDNIIINREYGDEVFDMPEKGTE